MKEIELDEYVRTKRGSIGKFKFYGVDDVDDKIVYFKNHNGTNCVDENEVTKHSSNIIDLIEVGDYVNGVEVIDKYKFGEQQRLVMIQTMEYGYENEMLEEHIKSIVTKEQFKSVMYEV